jgi:hypothetical protein
MKRTPIFVCLAMAAMALPSAAQNPAPQPTPQPQQSLAEAARAARAQKKPASTMVFDNDSLPKSGELSVVGAAAPAPKKEPPKDAKANKGAADKGTAEALAKRIEDKKKEISDIQKEMDLQQREHKLKQTLAYVDVGTKLRDQKKWDDDEKKFTTDVASNQKKLADAQKALADLETEQRAAASGQ